MRKRKVYFSLPVLLVILIIQNSCSPSWTTTIQWGSLMSSTFEETIEVEIVRGLIIIPVRIHGKYYRFLFDTGAPSSISENLQEEFGFKSISKGVIIDSENSRKKVKYIQMDTIRLNNIPFINQTAFVGDFESNPVIKCLGIHGIIGSNLIRFCNWKIDYKKQTVTISNKPLTNENTEYASISFNTDNQFNILVNMKAGASEIKNLKIDYGSNGSLSLPDNVFSTLKENHIFRDTYSQIGVSQSGLVGKIKKITNEIAYADSLYLNDWEIKNILVKSGGSGLIGTMLLSQRVIIIDWNKQELFFEDSISIQNNSKIYGYFLGVLNDGTIYIQSVIENSNAYKNSIRANMQVLKIDTLDFTQNHDFCNYVNYKSEKETTIIVVNDLNGERKEIHLIKEKLIPGN